MENNFKKLTGVVPLKIAEVGDYVQFGKIAWKVIGIEGEKKLLLSKDCMDLELDWVLGQNSFEELYNELMEDHTAAEDIEEDYIDGEFEEDMIDDDLAFVYSEKHFQEKYRACSEDYENIQSYLRKGFCEDYFSPEDIKKIVPYSIKASDQAANDYVFLLSRKEVEQYIPKKEDRIAILADHIFNVQVPWILRFDEAEHYFFAVDTEGTILVVDECCDQFRPAVWVNT